MEKDDTVDPRRTFLVQALSLGWLGAGLGWQHDALADWYGEVPRQLPPGRSVFEIQGEVWVNGERATKDTLIGPDDHIRTGDKATLIAVVGRDALLLRSGSELQLGIVKGVKSALRLVSGAMLAVFGHRDETLDITTPTATIGIRGTGVYIESEAGRSYVCTCYGRTELSASDDPASREEIVSRHHDAPRWILGTADADGRRIVPAEFQWHTDLELMMLEALVGREVPFKLEGMDYRGPRRDY